MVRAVAQGDMQNGPVFGGVDLLAAEHGFDPCPADQPGAPDRISKCMVCVGDAVLREIEQDIAQPQ